MLVIRNNPNTVKELTENWKITSVYRKSSIKDDATLQQILNAWPQLQDVIGGKLVSYYNVPLIDNRTSLPHNEAFENLSKMA